MLNAMKGPAGYIWGLLALVLTGASITALLNIPAVQPNLGAWIVAAAAACGLVSVPLSIKIGKSME